MVVTGRELVQGAVNTANERLLDRAVRHAILTQRLQNGEARALLRFLDNEVFPDVVAKLQAGLRRIRGRGFATVRTKQLRDLVASLDTVLKKGLGEAHDATVARLKPIAISEAEWQTGQLAREMRPLGFDSVMPSPAFASKIITERPFRGALLREWFDGLNRSVQNDVERQLRIGLIEGESIPALSRRIQDVSLDMTRRNATTIARTATNHVTTQAREAVYRANDDVVKSVEWVSTLDDRTTPICMGLDGRVFKIDEGPRPPAHMNCRSTTVPVLKSWKELGIDLKEAPPGTRASMNGQVPAKLTYGKWLKRQPTAIQNEALGPTRARLFREGKVKIDRFANDRNQTLTLAQLRRREGLSVADVAVKRASAGGARV